MKDAWLEAAEGIGTGQCIQGVVFFLSGIIILFLDIGQLLCQVPNSVVHMSEALHFHVEGFIPLLVDGKVDHGGEGLPRVEHVAFFLHKDPLRVQAFCCPEGA
jgi:hypothetical protein